MFDQLEISSIDRKHPVHMFARGCIMQIFTHGESTSFRFQISSLIVGLIIPFYHGIFYLTLLGGYKMLRHDQLLRCGVFYLYPPLAVLSLQATVDNLSSQNAIGKSLNLIMFLAKALVD